MKNSFLNKKIFITGAFGFLGNRLVEKLAECGAIIFVLVGPEDKGENSEASRIKKLFKGDLRDREVISKIIGEAKPDIIYHLAAITSVPYSKDYPLEVMDVNFGGTMNLLEAACRVGCEKFIHTSSVEIYEGANHPIDENHLISPDSPYAVSKAAADYLTSCYLKTYGMPTVVLRPFNIYGPGNFKNVIFKFIYAALQNGVLKLEGGDQIKDFLFADDAIKAFLVAGETSYSGVLNIGSGNAIAIKDLAKKIVALADSKAEIVAESRRDLKSKNYICNYSKIEKALGWKPQVGLDEGLKMTIDWAVKLNSNSNEF